jgi:hypothetical protein
MTKRVLAKDLKVGDNWHGSIVTFVQTRRGITTIQFDGKEPMIFAEYVQFEIEQ